MNDTPDYTPPKVWVWNKANGGRFANINRPIAGPTHEKELPVGRHPLQLYSLATPNGVKVDDHARGAARARPQRRRIRRLADPDRRRRSVRQRLRRGQSELQDPGAARTAADQADPGVRIRRDPALSRGEIRRVPADRAAPRAECLSWLFWQMGSAPYLGGGFGHFYAYAPTKIEYAIDRFAMEVKRQLDVLDRRLAESEYLAGADYTIADIAVWPWYGGLAQGPALRRRRIPAGAGLQERAALGRSDRRAAGGQARAQGQRPAAIRRTSCTSGTTPAISRPGRRTRSKRRNRPRPALVLRPAPGCRARPPASNPFRAARGRFEGGQRVDLRDRPEPLALVREDQAAGLRRFDHRFDGDGGIGRALGVEITATGQREGDFAQRALAALGGLAQALGLGDDEGVRGRRRRRRGLARAQARTLARPSAFAAVVA